MNRALRLNDRIGRTFGAAAFLVSLTRVADQYAGLEGRRLRQIDRVVNRNLIDHDSRQLRFRRCIDDILLPSEIGDLRDVPRVASANLMDPSTDNIDRAGKMIRSYGQRTTV